MKAFLKNYHQSPRKVRLVATAIQGKGVNEALTTLNFMDKRAADPIKQLVASALANAEHNYQLTASDLFVKELRVDKGLVMKRMMPGAHGRGYPLKHRTSHVAVLLAVKESPKNPKDKTVAKKASSTNKSEMEKETVKKAARKTVAKKEVVKKTTRSKTK